MNEVAETTRRRVLYPSFFIVGAGRSGTTLMRAIVTGHPDLVVSPETGFVPTLLRMRRLWWTGGHVRNRLFVRLAFANGRLRRAGATPQQLVNSLIEEPAVSPVDAISRIYETFVAKPTQARVGDKTPGYAMDVALLSKAFPQAKFIHAIRHPLDVVASMLQQPWAPDDPLAAGALWLHNVRACRALTIASDRMLVVRLEDLINDPKREVDRISGHLGVLTHENMLRFNDRAGVISQQNVHPSAHSGLHRRLAQTRRWQADLTDSDAAAVWSLVRGTAGLYGYEGPPTTRAPVSETAARIRLAWFRLSRSWRRARSLMRLLRP